MLSLMVASFPDPVTAGLTHYQSTRIAGGVPRIWVVYWCMNLYWYDRGSSKGPDGILLCYCR